jgi:hypothetical protein
MQELRDAIATKELDIFVKWFYQQRGKVVPVVA